MAVVGILSLLLVVSVGLVSALPRGAPPGACMSLTPGHGSTPIDPSVRPPLYFVVTDLMMDNGTLVYEPDQTYNISLIGVLGSTFRGFIIQARDLNGSSIGTFDVSNSNDLAQLVDCEYNNESTVTHTSNVDKSSITVQWTAPSDSGPVEFRYSVVITFSYYYVNLNAADFPVNCDIMTTDIGAHPLIFRMPENCLRQECEYFVGLGLNPSNSSYLDVYLEGNAAGWIAIGFSLNRQMENDDVLGCRVNSGTVTVVDTWNPSPRRTANVLDATQNGLCVQSTSFTNGRITCRFSRIINVTDIGQDYNLDDMFYLLFGRRAADQGATTVLGYHTANGGMTPTASDQQYNPVRDNNTNERCPIDATAIGSHNLVFARPEGCLRGSCEYYVGLSPNPSDSSYLDVYLEGNAAGWIAIGFSMNRQMENDDVLGCRVNSGTVTVVDTWNPSPQRTANVLDATQNGLCVQSTSFTNGRITCRFSRTIAITDVGQDYNLNNSFNLLFGRRTTGQVGTTALAQHSMTPTATNQQYNPVRDNNTNERCPTQATAIGSHNLVFARPEGCLRSGCEYYVGLSPNPSDSSYLDVYLEGNAAGWIAIGFSMNRQMENDDVLGCRVNSDTVTVVDTWNPSPQRTANVLDATQNGLCVQSTSFTNGRITCRFSRTIAITDVGQDYNLNNSFNLLFGRRAADQGTTTVLGYHTFNGGMTPTSTPQQYNPVIDMNNGDRCPIQATAIGSHNLVFGRPDGCNRTICEYYVGLSPNPSNSSYLDVYLEGNAAGWIAIGFSLNQQMENDDVLGCRVNSDTVTVVDTWNPSQQRAPNVLDATQNGLCVQSTSFTNGRITCRFSRTIAITDVGQDYNLNNSFNLLFGRRAADQGATTVLGYHTVNGGMTPTASNRQFNPVRDNNNIIVDTCPTQATAIGSHNLVFARPEGCLKGSCEYYVGLSPNPANSSYLDVYLEGNAAGWIAIGFSLNRQMENDDVLGCRVNSGTVTVVDTWNPSPQRTANVLDDTQNGLCVWSTSFTNGRITCSFSRTIAITDVGQDYNLNNSFNLLFGRRAADQGATTVLGYHTANGGMTPTASDQQYNPVRDNNTNERCPTQATAIGSHNLVFGRPDGCNRTTCEYYVGLSPNPSDSSYLDVYLEGNASGWIAIGFSLNRQMENDDVLGCRVNSDTVTVVDTWNPSPRRTANMLDATQNGLCVQYTSFTNGRITCRFSRTIAITDAGQDYNLDNSFNLLFGRRAADQGATTVLGYHTASGGMTPTATDQQFNPVRDRNTGCPPLPTGNVVYTFQQGTQGSGFYFGARVNPIDGRYLDVRLEGDATGWVGVGFSRNRIMEEDDVLVCRRELSSGMVTAVDTWNPSGRRQPNQLDPNQDDICPYSNSFENGRLVCTFSRLINTGDTSNDYNLADPFFQLYGTSNALSDGSLRIHDVTPTVTAQAVSVTNDTGAPTDDFPRRQLTRVHGILMILAWPLLVVSAIFFALWMKPALPNGEWFQIHRAFMIASLVLTALGFIFIFVANAENSGAPSPGLISFACGESTSHFVIGILVFLLQIINPIISIFRCKPTSSNRWIFNLTHGSVIGLVAELLALVNVGLGIALFESGCGGTGSYRLLWVYIAFVVFLMIIQVTMIIVFTVLTFRADPEKRAALAPSFLKYFFSNKNSFSPPQKDIEMTDKNKGAPNGGSDPPKKKPSEDSPIRWGMFSVFIIVTFILVIVMAIMVAVI